MKKRILLVTLLLTSASAAVANEFTFHTGDVILLYWDANVPSDSVKYYTVYHNGSSDTTSKLIMRFVGLTDTTRFTVTATNIRRCNRFQRVESIPSDPVWAYWLPTITNDLTYSVNELASYWSPGTLSNNRLGLWNEMVVKIPVMINSAGNYRIGLFCSGKSGTPRLIINGISSSIVTLGTQGSIYNVEIFLESGEQNIDITCKDGDLWFWGKNAIELTLQSEGGLPCNPPGKVINVYGKKENE